MKPIRHLPWALLCALPACGVFGLSQDERKELALHQSNAQLYYDGQRYDQALASVTKGLEIAPDDYKLTGIGGRILLVTSSATPANLDRAARMFDRLARMRSLDDHAPHALLGIGQCEQQLGLRHWRRAALLDTEIQNRGLAPAEIDKLNAQANEHRSQAEYHWREAERAFQALLRREELLRVAYKHLMEIAVERNDYDTATRWATEFLARNATEQTALQAIIRETMVLGFEREKRIELQELIEQEKRVRASLAEMHFRKGNHALAVDELTALLTLDPTRSNDYYNRALALEALGQHEAARRDHEKFLAATKLPASDKRVLHAVQFTLRSDG